ncbi:MAG: VOC family protein [Mycobacteriales bacterium]
MTGLQIAIDCHDPSTLARFWCAALDYEPAPPPPGHETWRAWYLSIGVPEDELGDGDCQDRIQDPAGARPPIWFQVVPEAKTTKNRVHLDIVIGRGLPKPERIEVVEQRARALEAIGATRVSVLSEYEDHYGVQLRDPEGNEFCIT